MRDVAWKVLFGTSHADVGDLLVELWDSLAAAGVAIRRTTVALRTLHPELVGLGFVWERGQGLARNEHPHSEIEQPRFVNSPLRALFDKQAPFRVRLTEGALPYPVLEELRGRGFTDYVGVPLRFTTGAHHALTLATDWPSGFADEELALFQELAAPLAAAIEARETRRVARTLLDTYVGSRAGAQVLEGRIRRGDVQLVDAVVLCCDLRGFTSLSAEIDPPALMAVLNTYFERVCEPIVAAGGEVLKFIGDGLLAIFPVEPGDESRERAACRIALGACKRALAALDDTGLQMGAALHVGQVAFGNIGSRTRLDFTVIGAAVNLASRLAGLSARPELGGRPLLVSARFAAQVPEGAVSLGTHRIRGLPNLEEVFSYR